jgi:hypothetical protein
MTTKEIIKTKIKEIEQEILNHYENIQIIKSSGRISIFEEDIKGEEIKIEMLKKQIAYFKSICK